MEPGEPEDELVSQFAAITGSEVSIARFYVEASNRNLSRAIESFYGRTDVPSLIARISAGGNGAQKSP
eukprot:CAMPEP_0182858654 /NCGR_PEP_ID=MMETSP0034_2-20130328/3805_1 /TAXON_ID=156128 /ORGANISM="Nephroselmis pyriformis, Strain CCMP717" /LENGTH=67 /DNA_ID=CAMNT_0024990103 /DNA_START=1 /DNA_END=200 /DNA_ORIENTATION=+